MENLHVDPVVDHVDPVVDHVDHVVDHGDLGIDHTVAATLMLERNGECGCHDPPHQLEHPLGRHLLLVMMWVSQAVANVGHKTF